MEIGDLVIFKTHMDTLNIGRVAGFIKPESLILVKLKDGTYYLPKKEECSQVPYPFEGLEELTISKHISYSGCRDFTPYDSMCMDACKSRLPHYNEIASNIMEVPISHDDIIEPKTKDRGDSRGKTTVAVV